MGEKDRWKRLLARSSARAMNSGGEAALLRSLLDQCAVIAWDPQPSGQPFADEPSAAAEFTADRNDIVTHIWHASCLESSKPPKPRFRRNSSSSTLYYSVFSEK